MQSVLPTTSYSPAFGDFLCGDLMQENMVQRMVHMSSLSISSLPFAILEASFSDINKLDKSHTIGLQFQIPHCFKRPFPT